MKFFKMLYFFIIMIILTSCSDPPPDNFNIRLEIYKDTVMNENTAILMDTGSQIIGKHKYIILNETIEYKYESMDYSFSAADMKQILKLITEPNMFSLLTTGGHYEYNGLAVTPNSLYRLTVYLDGEEYMISYDSSIEGCTEKNSELYYLRSLHLLLKNMMTTAPGYNALLSEYSGSISPFD